jgi:hypothetical protein
VQKCSDCTSETTMLINTANRGTPMCSKFVSTKEWPCCPLPKLLDLGRTSGIKLPSLVASHSPTRWHPNFRGVQGDPKGVICHHLVQGCWGDGSLSPCAGSGTPHQCSFDCGGGTFMAPHPLCQAHHALGNDTPKGLKTQALGPKP